MPNSEGIEQPEQIKPAADNTDSSEVFLNELTQSSPTDLGTLTLKHPSDNSDLNKDSGGDFIEIPDLSGANDNTDLTIDSGKDYGYRHPIADLAEKYEGTRPHLETKMMAGIPNPGRVAQAHFASVLIQDRGMPDIGDINGHKLASQLDKNPELFQKIDIDDRDSSELRAGDIVFGFRQPDAGRGHSTIGVVNNKGSVTWANSAKNGQVDTVSKEKFFENNAIRKYVAYRQDLLG